MPPKLIATAAVVLVAVAAMFVWDASREDEPSPTTFASAPST